MEPLPPGSTLQGGTYTVGKMLGQGGSASVYLGTNKRLRCLVAIKEWTPPDAMRLHLAVQALSSGQHQEGVGRFRTEAEVLSRFHHTNLLRVFDFFEENGTAYIVTEHLKGDSLQVLVGTQGRLPASQAVEMALQAGLGLQEVHAQNYIHHDVNPSNLILCEGGRVVVVDFGLCRKPEVATRHKTRKLDAAARFGTPGYAALEQYKPHLEASAATDVYALSATLYFLLTAQPPLEATHREMGQLLLPPHEQAPGLSREISDAVMWGLQLDAARRPQTIGELSQALREAITPTPKPAQPVAASTSDSRQQVAMGSREDEMWLIWGDSVTNLSGADIEQDLDEQRILLNFAHGCWQIDFALEEDMAAFFDAIIAAIKSNARYMDANDQGLSWAGSEWTVS